ncbi:HPr family phosphocarrier protein [Acidobacteria bacterium AH-259-D05]|nr:HPr family phosphocarrier protein [Acidobacteria bacterium AH-259-D05]
MIRKTLRIKSELGLHARAAAKLVKLSSQFESDIKLSRLNGQQQVDAKSILGILLLAAAKGTELQVVANGSDEKAAMEALVELIDSRFGEDK